MILDYQKTWKKFHSLVIFKRQLQNGMHCRILPLQKKKKPSYIYVCVCVSLEKDRKFIHQHTNMFISQD